MAHLEDENMCYPHAWVGKGHCPECAADNVRKFAAEEMRWASLTVDEKLDELKRRLDGDEID